MSVECDVGDRAILILSRFVKCWDSNSIGDEGTRHRGIGVDSDGFP